MAAARLRLLIVELALRCYELEQGQPPSRLDQMVPKCLQRVLADPFSTSPLIYRSLGTNHLLYSVRPDRVDDGGKPGGQPASGMIVGIEGNKSGPAAATKGDLFYDSQW